MGGMNLYFVKGRGKDATIFTPKLTGTLLHGITRDSILSVAKDLGYKVEEGMISIDQWRDGVASGEFQRSLPAEQRQLLHLLVLQRASMELG
jgi:Branched-chain amino acid aminotransferase/4-amino-4-deoxychorismate lyase